MTKRHKQQQEHLRETKLNVTRGSNKGISFETKTACLSNYRRRTDVTVVSKTKHSKTKIEARSTPKLENEAL